MLLQTILEGFGLGILLVLLCAIGIRRGAVGMVHLYSSGVQMRCVELGLTTNERIKRNALIFKVTCIPIYLAYVLICVYAVNGARGFISVFWQCFVILFVMNLIDRFGIDDFWVGHTKAWVIPGTEDLQPYITKADKRRKWMSGTVGMAAISLVLAGIGTFFSYSAAYVQDLCVNKPLQTLISTVTVGTKGGNDMKILTALAVYLLYWFACFLGTGTDKKNLAGLRSYPESVQRAVLSHPKFLKEAPKEKSIASVLLGNLLLFTVLFSVLGLTLKNLLGLNEFWTAFWFFFVLGEVLGVFDLTVIDLLWWRNTKRIRFSFLPEKKYYQDPSKHISSFLRGIPLFAVVALMSTGIVMLIG